ncbi:30S ribosomal protein S16 [Gammaproteobacteria bacterium]|nr:30S ribosomal protein S16 [Gammaproteobacteria bacterium]
MVVVRLAKSGAKKNPYYFITVADSRKPRDGAFIERLGFFNPSAKGSEERMRFNVDRLDHWISQGAQLSDKVKELAKDARLSSDDLQAKLDAKKDRRTQKKEAIKAQKVAELEAKAKEAAEEEASIEEGAVEDAVDAAKDVVEDVVEAAADVAEDAVDAAKDVVEDVVETVSDAVEDLVDMITPDKQNSEGESSDNEKK